MINLKSNNKIEIDLDFSILRIYPFISKYKGKNYIETIDKDGYLYNQNYEVTLYKCLFFNLQIYKFD